MVQYKKILAMFHAAYRQTEQAKPESDIADSPVMEWLEADMACHGVTPLTWSSPALSLDTESKLWGYLYVKQGSTLGGQFISKQLKNHLNIDADQNRFFNGYGAQTGMQWRQFKDAITARESSLNPAEVIATAKVSFEMIRDSADRMV